MLYYAFAVVTLVDTIASDDGNNRSSSNNNNNSNSNGVCSVLCCAGARADDIMILLPCRWLAHIGRPAGWERVHNNKQERLVDL